MTAVADRAAAAVGRVVADPPVVLAPMAGITNTAFRRLCREAMATALEPGRPAGCSSREMITTRALVERNPKTLQLIRFAADETPRSIQLYGVDPAVVGAAVRMIVDEDLADHVDLNFGCPVPKVTRKGGGSALPWRIGLFDDIVRAAVREARGAVPVTVKMRVGIDAEHVTYREAGLRAQDAGVAHVALHGRTAPSSSTAARPTGRTIAELVDAARHPGARQRRHLGGRRRAAHGPRDRLRRRGRRPRLPRPAVAVRRPRRRVRRPRRARTARAWARWPPRCAGTPQLLAEWLGEQRGVTDFRKHVAWYLKGFAVGGELRAGRWRRRRRWPSSTTTWPASTTTSRSRTRCSASRAGGPAAARPVALPEGWLASRDSRAVPFGAELADSGG